MSTNLLRVTKVYGTVYVVYIEHKNKSKEQKWNYRNQDK